MENFKLIQYRGTIEQNAVLEALNLIVPDTTDMESGSIVAITTNGFEELKLEDVLILFPTGEVFIGGFVNI